MKFHRFLHRSHWSLCGRGLLNFRLRHLRRQQVRTSQTDFGKRHLRQAAGKDIKDGHRVKTSETDMIRERECLSGNQNRKGGKRNG